MRTVRTTLKKQLGIPQLYRPSLSWIIVSGFLIFAPHCRDAAAATINVCNYAACKGGNVTAAVQTAISASSPGDTVYFPAGIYQIGTVTLLSSRTYQGATGAVLQQSGTLPMVQVDEADSHDLRIDGFRFQGTGSDPDFSGLLNVSGTNSASSVNHITVSNNTFYDGGLSCAWIKNSQLVSNAFNGGNGIICYDPDYSSINGNGFTNVSQGMSLRFYGGSGHNVTVANNIATGLTRMFIEAIDPPNVAGACTNLVVQNNWATNWNATPSDTDTIAYSMVCGSNGVHVVSNYAKGPTGNANPWYNGYCVELAFTSNGSATGNYCDGFTTGIIAYSNGAVIENNNIINATISPLNLWGNTGDTVKNNTSNPNLPVPAPPSGTSAPPAPPTQNNGTIVLHVAGDQWQGAPMLQLLVNGMQVGGNYPVTVQHSSGQWQEIDISTTLYPITTIALKFINDAYGGPGNDRNIWVHDIVVNGQTFGGNQGTNNACWIQEPAPVALMCINGTLAFNIPNT